MRSSLRLLIASAISLGSIACTSDLWSRYVRDTDDSCLRVGCPAGGTCSVSTGLCEGGSADMGTADMADPAPDYFFGPPQPITPSSIYSAAPFYQLATTVLDSPDNQPEIWLSGPKPTLTRLTPLVGNGMYSEGSLTLDEQPCFLTSIQGSAKRQQDLLVGQLAQKFSRVIDTKATTNSTEASGFKLLSVGDLNRDGLPDALVTGSALSLANLSYKGYPNSRPNGKADIFVSDASYQLQKRTVLPNVGSLISASIQQGPIRADSGFNVAVIEDGQATTAHLGKLDVAPGSPTFEVLDKLTIPVSDFAIPVDLNADGFNDLVLVQLWDGNTPLTDVRGAVHIAHNSGGEGKFIFAQEHIVPVPINPGVVLTVKVDDFDQDGFPDLAIVTATLAGGDVLLYHNEPPPTTTKEPLRKLRYIGKMSSNYAGRAVEFVDLNRDGCKDVLMLFSGGTGTVDSGTSILWAAGRKARRGLIDCF